MEIKIINTELKDVWDIQRAKKVLEILGLSSNGVIGLTIEQKKKLEKEITIYLWNQILKQFPQIKSFCNGKTGGFNKCEKEKENTPIINIHGSFYLQLISLKDSRNWCWESINLEPYRFAFNEEGYFKGLIVDGINKAIMEGTTNKETFKDLINALNENKTEESVLTIKTSGKDMGKVDIHKVKTNLE